MIDVYLWLAAAGGFLIGALLALWVRRDCRRQLDQALTRHRRLYHPGQARGIDRGA